MERRKAIDELREIMAAKNISHGTAARLIDCSKSSIFRWLSGECLPTKVYARMIQNAIKRMKVMNGGMKD